MSNDVLIYGFSVGCHKCNSTKKGFDLKGVPWQFIDLATATPEQAARAEELKQQVLAAGGTSQAPLVEDPLTGAIWSDLRPDNIRESAKARA